MRSAHRDTQVSAPKVSFIKRSKKQYVPAAHELTAGMCACLGGIILTAGESVLRRFFGTDHVFRVRRILDAATKFRAQTKARLARPALNCSSQQVPVESTS